MGDRGRKYSGGIWIIIWGGAVGPWAGITEHLLFILIFLLPLFSWGWEGLQ